MAATTDMDDTDRTRLDLRSVVAASPAQVSRRLPGTPGETIVLHTDSGTYYGLSDVGAAVWEMLGQPVAVDEIVNRLTAIYEVNTLACRTDVLALLNDLRRAGLVTVKGSDKGCA